MDNTTLNLKSQSGPNAWLYREALQNGYVNYEMTIRSTGIFYCNHFEDQETRYRAWLCESLLTALEHPDPIIRIRATCQAIEYGARLFGLGSTPGPRHCDAIREARQALERMVPETGLT